MGYGWDGSGREAKVPLRCRDVQRSWGHTLMGARLERTRLSPRLLLDFVKSAVDAGD